MSELKAVTEYIHGMLVLTITLTIEDGKVCLFTGLDLKTNYTQENMI